MHSKSHLENPNSRCNKNGICSFNFPYKILTATKVLDNGRLEYRRRKEEDQWVVSHIPFLITAMQCHIHADICSKAGVFMYMYKYLFKGPDRCNFTLNGEDVFDEYKEYIQGRYLSSSEAAWRILDYNINTKVPSVKRINIHLPGTQYGQMFQKNGTQSQASQILRYFHRPLDQSFDKLTISQYFQLFDLKPSTNSNYNESDVFWEAPSPLFQQQIVIRKKVLSITRLQLVNTRNRELFFLRQLLLIRYGRSFKDLRTVGSIVYKSFEEAAKSFGLCNEGNEAHSTLKEAADSFISPSQFRFLFTQLISDLPVSAIDLWNEFKTYMTADFLSAYIVAQAEELGLTQIDQFLRGRGLTLEDVGLPSTRLILEELETEQKLLSQDGRQNEVKYFEYLKVLNAEQHEFFRKLQESFNLNMEPHKLFFITGKAGTGKSFLIKTLIAYMRSQLKVVLIVGSTALCVQQYERSQTAHSMFKIPITQVRI
jgi:PIF1-like helicase